MKSHADEPHEDHAHEDRNKDLPGYPLYPEKEDIFNRGQKESDLDPEDPTRQKAPNEDPEGRNEKDFDDLFTGDDLDVPGAELDDEQENAGSEDEENNYYSLGDNE